MEYNKQNLTDRENYNCIDLVKFIGAILVVMHHIAPFENFNETNLIGYLNYVILKYLIRIVVPFFFVCSGFFLYKKTAMESFDFEPTRKYVFRMFRLYIIWSLIYFPLSLKQLLDYNIGIVHAILIYIKNFVFNGSYTHLWYLNATIFAVLLISFLLCKKINPKHMVMVAFVLYIIGLLGQSWFGLISPLRYYVPSLWHLLRLIKKIIVTTRNGLFEGFLFVGFGMLFAFYDIKIPKKKAFICFIISTAFMLLEAFILEYLNFVRVQDMYLFLVPTTFFGFSFISQVKLPNCPLFKILRILSMLMYYSHFWVCKIIEKLLEMVNESLTKTYLLSILTLMVTIIGSSIVVHLSKYPKMKWLKIFYT